MSTVSFRKLADDPYREALAVNFNNKVGTLFGACKSMMTVETLRNPVIHDVLLDDMPNAYDIAQPTSAENSGPGERR